MKTSKKKAVILALILIYAAVVILGYSTNIIDESYRNLYQRLFYLVAPAVTVLGGIYAFKKHGFKTIQGKALLYLLLGFSLFFIAEILFSVLDGLLHQDIYPSVADIVFITAYPFIIIGAFLSLRLGKINWSINKLLVNLLIILSFAFVTYYLAMQGIYDEEVTFLENAITIAYGVSDLVIIILSILMFNLSLEFKGGLYSKSWLIFGIGMVLYWLGDIIVYGVFIDQYEAQIPAFRQFDYFWIAAHLMLGLALFMQGKAIDSVKKDMANKLKNSPNHGGRE